MELLFALEVLRLSISDFLNIVLVQNSFIFVNLWSLVHFTSGFIVMYLLIGRFNLVKSSSTVLLFLGLLVVYELFEFLIYSNSSVIFRKESSIDVIWDLIIGLAGGAVAMQRFGNPKI